MLKLPTNRQQQGYLPTALSVSILLDFAGEVPFSFRLAQTTVSKVTGI